MYRHDRLYPDYTIQPVEQPAVQPVECLHRPTRCNRLFNRFDNRLYRVNGVLECTAMPLRVRICCGSLHRIDISLTVVYEIKLPGVSNYIEGIIIVPINHIN